MDALVLGAVVGVLVGYLRPSLLLSVTTATGGDTGAQIYPPWYLKTHLLPRGLTSGWSPGWFGGFPILQFYFPLVPLFQATLSYLIPYEVAFKLGTALGTFFLPVAVYLTFRLLRIPFPAPAVGALLSLSFLLAKSFSIYGGNIASSLAGEYSFSLSLGLCLVFLALLYRVLVDRRGHAIPAALILALAVLSHLVPVFQALLIVPALAIIGARTHGFRTTFLRLFTVFGLAFALTAFWSVPFLIRLPYTSNMHWIPLRGWEHLAPAEFRVFLAVGAGAVLLAALARDRRVVVWLGPGVASVVVYFLLGEGHVWNARLLPFWYLSVILTAAYGIGVVSAWLMSTLASRGRSSGMRAAPVLLSALILVALAVAMGRPILGQRNTSFVDGWIRWNYQGYERKAAYPELRALMDTMRGLPPGRTMWEPSSDYLRFGTTDALMTLPYFSGQPSMEGVHYESSMTTPFHFLTASEIGDRPFNPIPGLPYRAFDLQIGMEHMRLLGVRYYITYSERATEAAGAARDLRPVATAGQFSVFELADNGQVVVPRYEPVVLSGRDWVSENIRWFSDPGHLEVPLVREGPSEWARVTGVGERLPRKRLPHAGTVMEANVRDDQITFRTSAVGEPHWIRTSFFPNWKVDGALGPFLASPSLMMVVPTQPVVRLHYGRTWPEWSGLTLTLAALLMLLLPATRRRMRIPGLGPPTIVPWIERTIPERHHDLMRRLTKFGVVSVLATAVDLVSFNVLLAWSSFSVLASASLSYLLGLAASYLLNRWFTFPGRGRHSRTEEITAFTLISLVGLGLNNGAVALAAGVLGEGALVLSAAKIVAAALVWLLKFGMIQRWVFPAPPHLPNTRERGGATASRR